ncbi:MAG: sigma-70 family RNA polymerase sigma factor [Phycisphaeraceae bacterium]
MTTATLDPPRSHSDLPAVTPRGRNGLPSYHWHPLFAEPTVVVMERLYAETIPEPEVGWYGAECSCKEAVGLLSREQEQALFLRLNYARYQLARIGEAEAPRHRRARDRWSQRERGARDHLITANLGLVVHIAARVARRYRLEVSDLIAEGNLPLMRAVQGFNPGLGRRFSTYAWPAIDRHLRRVVRDERSRSNLSLQTPLGEDGRVDLSDLIASGRPPSARATCPCRGRGRGHQARARADCPHCGGRGRVPVPDPGSRPHTPSPEEVVQQREERLWIDLLLGDLDERKRIIVSRRFGLAGQPRQTLTQVGREIGMTKERVRQLQNQALQQMRGRAADLGRESL